MRLISLIGILIFLASSGKVYGQYGAIISNGHSHNDYKQTQPLYNALKNGFTSIEIDVYSYGEEIRVSHLSKRLSKKPDLEALYLLPLKKLIDENGGWVFPGSKEQVILMIDLKSDKVKLILLLGKMLIKYQNLIDKDGDESIVSAPLRILLSGGPNVNNVLSDETGLLSLDGRYSQAQAGYPVEFMPRISINYKSHFSWRGIGKMRDKEYQLLQEIVSQVHSTGRQIRFYNSPDNAAVWKVLLESGVDWINVDDLEKYYNFKRSLD